MLAHSFALFLPLVVVFLPLLYQYSDALNVYRHAHSARSLASRHHALVARKNSYLDELDTNRTRDEVDYIVNWMPMATCTVENAAGALKEKYTLTLVNFEDTGYCGKGFADNLHEQCKRNWDDGWSCKPYKSGSANGPWEYIIEFYLPQVTEYNCVENAIAIASNHRAPWAVCTGEHHGVLDTLLTALQIAGDVLLPIGSGGGLIKASSATIE